MPLNRPALSLGPGPRGVQDARRWITRTFSDIGRDDLVECAELAVSEVVTNAILHGAPPVQVRVRGTAEHPRVEVRDASSEPPVMPTDLLSDSPEGEDDFLLTFGRGLAIVARASDSWGANMEDDGKVVWFVPAAEFREDDGAEGLLSSTVTATEQTGDLPADLMDFRFPNLPVTSYLEFQRHFRELRREVRLLALAHESTYPLAPQLAGVFDTLGRPLLGGHGSPEVEQAIAQGRTQADATIVMSRSTALGVRNLLELLDLTDAFCREERMLTLARTPEQRRFQEWFLGEFAEQARGHAPTRWQPADDVEPGTGGASDTTTSRQQSVS